MSFGPLCGCIPTKVRVPTFGVGDPCVIIYTNLFKGKKIRELSIQARDRYNTNLCDNKFCENSC